MAYHRLTNKRAREREQEGVRDNWMELDGSRGS